MRWSRPESGAPALTAPVAAGRSLEQIHQFEIDRLEQAGVGHRIAVCFPRASVMVPPTWPRKKKGNTNEDWKVFIQMLVIEKAALRGSEVMVDPGLPMTHHPAGSGGIERQSLASFEILFWSLGSVFVPRRCPVLRRCRERIIGTDPGAIERWFDSTH